MRRISVYIEGTTVFVDSDGDIIQVKDFGTVELAEEFINSIDNAVERKVNALFVDEKSMEEKINEVQGLLKNEPQTKETVVLSNMLKILQNAGAKK